jgi:hypothetical protein
MIRYVAIYETLNGDKFVIEYRPIYSDAAGAIEIISVEHTKRLTWAEQRAEYTRTPVIRPPRQIPMFD